MLRVIASRNAKEYYSESLKREDYYTEGQEIRGEWQGIGAEKLGLSGAVDQAAFDALCENRKPGTDERLTQRNKGNRIVGYDFNFDCPKSVSVVYEFTLDVRDNWQRLVIESYARAKGGNWPECRSGCWMGSRDALSSWNERPRSWASPPPKERTDWPRSPANANRNSFPKWNCENYGTS